MKIHHLMRRQRLPISQDVAWAFFSNPASLMQITPPWLRMTDESYERPKLVYAGLIQVYRARVLGFVPVRWVAEITHVDAPNSFIDEQKAGPFAFWKHEHRLTPIETGMEVMDIVHYGLPVGGFGRAAHSLFVRRQLDAMFDYRARMLREFFEE